MGKDLYFNIILLISFIIDITSSLHLSHESAIKNVGDTFVVICKDKSSGQPVSWRGPNNVRLGQRTRPKVEIYSYGTAIMFNKAREEDSGSYTCSINGLPNEKNVFKLKVVAPFTQPTTSDNEIFTDKPIQTTTETNVPPPVATETITNKIYYPIEVTTEEINTIASTTEELFVVKVTAEEEIDVQSATVETVLNTYNIDTTTEARVINRHGKNKNKKKKKKPESDLEFKDTPSVQYINEGSNGTLRCEVNKNDAPIQWLFASNNFPVENSENMSNGEPKYEKLGDGLLIRNVTREDSKVYVCQAIDESIGSFKNQNITLIVQHQPKEIYAQEDIIYGFLNEEKNLTCEVEAIPTPKFKWSAEQNGEDIAVSNYVIDESSHKSILQIIITETHNTSVTYKCMAFNDIGEKDIYFNVQLALQPDAPTNITVTDVSSESLQLKITLPEVSEQLVNASMQPNLLVVEYRVDRSSNSSEEEWLSQEYNITDATPVQLLLLKGLEKSTTYQIQVATKNVGGLSEYLSTYATTAAATRCVQATMPIFSVLLVYLSILLSSEMRKA